MSGHILAALESGCMVGEADGGFHPEDPVTRAELAVTVACLAGIAAYPEVPGDPCVIGSFADSIANCIRQEWAGTGVEEWAVRLSWCESHHDPWSYNAGSGAAGLFQFLQSTWLAWGEGDVFNPKQNASAARRLWEALGPSQWECNV